VTAYVLDASVAAKWFLPSAGEPLAGEALQVLRDYAGGRLHFLVPDLFWPEFGNILWKAVRCGRMTPDSAEKAITAVQELNLPTTPSSSVLKDAFAIATAYDRTVYDATYVALAVTSNAPLLTANERLANALAARLPIRWLGAL
jgi:predicted nucleic acid-binding protein